MRRLTYRTRSRLRLVVGEALVVAVTVGAAWSLAALEHHGLNDARTRVETRTGLLGWRTVEQERAPELHPWATAGTAAALGVLVISTGVCMARVRRWARFAPRERDRCPECGRDIARSRWRCPECGVGYGRAD